MNLHPKLLVAGIAVIAIGALWLRLNVVVEQRDGARAARDQAWRDSAQRQVAIDALQGQLERLAAQQVASGKRQAALEREASQRQVKIRTLENEHAETKRWSDSSLPDDVVRMQQRPAVTGSADYLEYVRSTRALHFAPIGHGD